MLTANTLKYLTKNINKESLTKEVNKEDLNAILLWFIACIDTFTGASI